MSGPAAQLAGRLAREAEAVCRHYLSNGRRAGRYWLVGDVFNTPGRSLYVRLSGPEAGRGAAGHWTDAATGEHGDLLDLIALNGECGTLQDALAEARRFLSLPRPSPPPRIHPPAPPGSTEAVRRLFAAARPIAGTSAERYLCGRGITPRLQPGSLRYHPGCYYRRDDGGPAEAHPALLAAVTDLGGALRGVQRTWLARDGGGKARLSEPRRAMGDLLGHGVRFGVPVGMLAAGEGIETMLSLRTAVPRLPCIAALSANHLAALVLPEGLRHLYIARDRDRAGLHASQSLEARAVAAGIDVWTLVPVQKDFHDDLCSYGVAALQAQLLDQLAPNDACRLALGADS